MCEYQHPRAGLGQNTHYVLDEQHPRPGQNTQPLAKSKMLIKVNAPSNSARLYKISVMLKCMNGGEIAIPGYVLKL